MSTVEPFRELVSLAVAAFVGCENDEAVRRFLVSAGASTELADELVAFVPLAFGRRLLDTMGVSTHAAFDVVSRDGRPTAERRFQDHPAYLAAVEAAARAERETFQRLAAWSAEVRAVSSLMGSGPASNVRLTKPALWSPHLVDRGPAGAPRPLAELHGASAALERALTAHGIRQLAPGEAFAVEVFGEWCSNERVVLQVDFVLRSPKLGSGRALVESFAGVGDTVAEAVRNAFEKFLTGSFHALLAALFGVVSDHVDRETWSTPRGSFQVVLGPLLQVGAVPPSDAFSRLVDRARDRLAARELSREVHWVRMFCMRGSATSGAEALLDGETFPELLADVETWPFPQPQLEARVRDWGYSAHCLIVLVPADWQAT